MGTRTPFSVRPGPTAITSPWVGFSLAVSGMYNPPRMVSISSLGMMTTRSSNGVKATFGRALVAVAIAPLPTTWGDGGKVPYLQRVSTQHTRVPASWLKLNWLLGLSSGVCATVLCQNGRGWGSGIGGWACHAERSEAADLIPKAPPLRFAQGDRLLRVGVGVTVPASQGSPPRSVPASWTASTP